MTPSIFGFFAALLRPSAAIVFFGAAIVSVGTWLGMSGAGDFDQTFALVLLLQMFAAATGFTHAARRGHFDPVLCSSHRRTAVALVHAAASMVPGAAAWIAVVCVDQVLRRDHVSTGLTLSGLASLLWVSVVAWCATLRLPRYSGGLLWLFLFVTLASLHQLQALEPMMLDQTTWPAVGKAVVAVLTAPLLLVAHPSDVDPPLVAAVIGVSAIVLGAGVWSIAALDVSLTEPS